VFAWRIRSTADEPTVVRQPPIGVNQPAQRNWRVRTTHTGGALHWALLARKGVAACGPF
jgi:hypothetical protein